MELINAKLIGSGAEADVYLFENKAVKVFKYGRPITDIRYEADLQGRAYRAGLPVPAIYDTCEIDGKAAIIMEHVKGKTIGGIMLENMDKAPYYLEISVDLQIKVHKVNADGFPCQKEKLKNNIISASYLEESQKHKLLCLLQNLESGSSLCHGDFHILNLLQTSDDVKIIDWVCASSGSSASDVCRTYLLYLLYRSEIAETYLDIYCSKSSLSKQEILAWLPVVAGARLNENVTEADIRLLLNIVNGNHA